MNGKRFADIMICCIAAAIMALAFIYIESKMARYVICGAGSAAFLVFMVLAVSDTGREGQRRRKKSAGSQSKGVHALALLDENDEEISEWNIAGKISLLIGRDTRKEDVDINLMNTSFAGMVDRQHAVMNYAAGQWHIEDLGSANGIRIQKEDGRIYEVSKTQPCVVEKGDIVFIGLTKLKAK